MIDRTTKALMLAIALGLWMNVASQWLKPTPVHAQDAAGLLASIESDVRRIARGTCTNARIC